MNKEENNPLIDLVGKQLAGEATSQELVMLEKLLEIPDNKKLSIEYRKVWEASHTVQGVTEHEVRSEWLRLEEVIDSKSKNQPGFSWIKAAAVVAFILLGSGAVYQQFFRVTDYQIYAASVKEATLPDGSVITLNSGSYISYEDSFNDNKREVWLKGEGYFDVVSNPDKPFLIHTDGADILVVGTSFNVATGTKDSGTQVVVTSGVVKLFNEKESVTLEKGDSGVVDVNSGDVSKSAHVDENLMSWRTRSFVFDDTSLSNVVAQLGKVYGKKIRLANESMDTCPVTVSFNDVPLEDVLLILSSTLDIEIKAGDNEIVLTGTGCL